MIYFRANENKLLCSITKEQSLIVEHLMISWGVRVSYALNAYQDAIQSAT